MNPLIDSFNQRMMEMQQMLANHKTMLMDMANQSKGTPVFAKNADFEGYKQELEEKFSDLVEAITAIAEEIGNIKNAPPPPSPQDIKLVYKGKKLDKAVMTKTDGTTVEVPVGRNK